MDWFLSSSERNRLRLRNETTVKKTISHKIQHAEHLLVFYLARTVRWVSLIEKKKRNNQRRILPLSFVMCELSCHVLLHWSNINGVVGAICSIHSRVQRKNIRIKHDFLEREKNIKMFIRSIGIHIVESIASSGDFLMKIMRILRDFFVSPEAIKWPIHFRFKPLINHVPNTDNKIKHCNSFNRFECSPRNSLVHCLIDSVFTWRSFAVLCRLRVVS